MTWEYLAGFTDADGYIVAQMSGDYINAGRIGWSQTASARWVLEEIQTWLGEQGLASSLTDERDRRVGTLSCRLRMARKAHVRIALNSMLPHLVLKRDRAKHVLRLLEERDRAIAERGRRFR
jgi:intein/homing endonuclease